MKYSLNSYLNLDPAIPNIVFKGSDGSSTTTQSTVMDEEYKPMLDTILGDLQSTYTSGALGQVAEESALQTEAFNAASGTAGTGLDAITAGQSTYSDAANMTGSFSPSSTAALEQQAIDSAQMQRNLTNDAVAGAGVVGGSRSGVMASDQDAQLANELAGIKYEADQAAKSNALTGAGGLVSAGAQESATQSGNLQTMAALGGEQRGVEQHLLDADAIALERYMTGFESMGDFMTTDVAHTESTGGGK